MSDYGVTMNGFVRKRNDIILAELQKDLSDALGFDVAQNPQSFLNVFVTNFSNRIATLWEVAEEVYYSQFPVTAEGISLDYVGQYAGILREDNAKTRYTIQCKGNDGTLIPAGTRLATNTMPKKYFSLFDTATISSSSFNEIAIKCAVVEKDSTYSVSINDNAFSVMSSSNPTSESIITALYDEINLEGFSKRIEDGMIILKHEVPTSNNVAIMSENLAADKVVSNIIFRSEEYGKIVTPANTIVEIATPVSGFDSCTNLVTTAYGRIRETDTEFRQSYLKKIAARSNSMIESITSAILDNVSMVETATGYENPTDDVDEEGRPPHSVEIIVTGGDEDEIAAQILRQKAAGIATFGDVLVHVPDEFSGTIPIRFNRPTRLFAWLKVIITPKNGTTLPTGYTETIKASIINDIGELASGESLYCQDLLKNIYAACANLAYVDIYCWSTTSESAKPTSSSFRDRNIEATSRQKIECDIARIEVTTT